MDKVMCPYCGAEMFEDPESAFKDRRELDYWYWCEKCGSQSPRKSEADYKTVAEARESALAAALRRYVEPNRVLTIDEALERANDPDVGCMWTEWIGALYFSGWMSTEIVRASLRSESQQSEYGIVRRVWLRRPTDEERGAAAWE